MKGELEEEGDFYEEDIRDNLSYGRAKEYSDDSESDVESVKEVRLSGKRSEEIKHERNLELIIQEKNMEIEDLLKNMEILKNSDKIKSQLIFLAKKNKELQVQVNRKDAMLKSLANQSIKEKDQNKEYSGNVSEELEYKRKYTVAMNNLQQVRRDMEFLRGSSIKMKKALLREVGNQEEVERAINMASEELPVVGGGWKGRAELIESLNMKIKSLRIKLKMATSCQGISKKEDETPSSPGRASSVGGKSSVTMGAAKRREEISDLLSQVKNLEENALQEKNRKKALQSRISALESQVAELHGQAKLLIEKSKNDDELIADLRRYVEHSPQVTNQPNKRNFHENILNIEIERLKQQCKTQKEIILKLTNEKQERKEIEF